MDRLLIDCPNCGTAFEVMTGRSLDGRKLRCSECKYVWVFNTGANNQETHHAALHSNGNSEEKSQHTHSTHNKPEHTGLGQVSLEKDCNDTQYTLKNNHVPIDSLSANRERPFFTHSQSQTYVAHKHQNPAVEKAKITQFKSTLKCEEEASHLNNTHDHSTFTFQDIAYRKQKIALPIPPSPKQTSTSFLLYLTTIFLLALILSTFLFGFKDWYLSDLSLSTKTKLFLSDVQMMYKDNKLTVLSKVINGSSSTDSMPLVRVRLMDNKDRIVVQKFLNYQHFTLQPGQEFSIKTDFDAIPRKIKYIDISLGSKWDFFIW